MSRIILVAPMLALGIVDVLGDAAPVGAQDGGPNARAEACLRTNAHRLGLRSDLQDLELIAVREGLSDQHVRYQQALGGVAVFGRFLTVSPQKEQGSAASPLVVSRYRQGTGPVPDGASPTAREALDIVGSFVSVSPGKLRGAVSVDLTYCPIGGDEGAEHVLSWQVAAPVLDPLGRWLFVLRADTGEVLPPSFGSTSAHANYSARKDLIPIGIINVLDMSRVLPPLFGSVCS